MQVADCMHCYEHCWDPYSRETELRIAGEWQYNLGAGVNVLINKWNWMAEPTVRQIAAHDHTVPECWYYAVTSYNKWNLCNDPNRNYWVTDPNLGCAEPEPFDPRRAPSPQEAPPGDPYSEHYPYQERIWGWAAHPGASEGHPLWRATYVAPVPRGVFGLSGTSWRPPEWTPKPVYHLLRGINVSGGTGPTISLRNSRADATVAADVLFYDADGTFRKRWSVGDANPPLLRLAPGESTTLNVADAFPGPSLDNGYVRASASEGLEVRLRHPRQLYMPLGVKNQASGKYCVNALSNGGFEQFVDGNPAPWNVVISADQYPLADGTWFATGNYGAHLGGYDYADDWLSQNFWVPAEVSSATLTLSWSVRSQDVYSTVWDVFRLSLRRSDTTLIRELGTLDNTSPRDTWRTWTIDLTADLASNPLQYLQLTLEAMADESLPTSFFVDDVRLVVCTS